MSDWLGSKEGRRTHTQAPLPPQIPPEEEAPMEDVGQNDPLQLSNSTRAALDQLLSQIDHATSTVETHLTADSYAALAALPLSYPWSCLVLDLKELLPILDRYALSCIIASHATLYTDLTHDQALFPLLKALAQTCLTQAVGPSFVGASGEENLKNAEL